MTWGRSVLIALDQLGNSLTGGRPDVTVSARLGFLALVRGSVTGELLGMLVDAVFYAVDGAGHCAQAYYKHEGKVIVEGHWTSLVGLWLITIPFCVVIFPFTLVSGAIMRMKK